MADVNFSTTPATPASPDGGPRKAEPPLYDLIELFFFAYRDFVADADEMLTDYAFGRAHHRVLHFVDRNPGLTVADLLDILRITKQSLGRVLKELVDQGFIEQREGTTDRRQRLLYTTLKGQGLARDLAALQTTRIRRALQQTGTESHTDAARFLFALVDPDKREAVAAIVSGGRNERD